MLLTFTFPNRFLQRQDPCIYAAQGQLNGFVLRLLGKSVRIAKIEAAKTIEKVNFEGESQQLRDRKLFICFATKQTLVRLSDDGDIDEKKKDRLYQAVRDFYQRAVLEEERECLF